jgi:hypothetical protein
VSLLGTAMVHFQTGQDGMGQDFTTLLRVVCNLKFVDYFWNFPLNIFRMQLAFDN